MTIRGSFSLVAVVMLQGAWGPPPGAALSANEAAPPNVCYLVEVAPNASVDEVAAHAADATGGIVVRKYTTIAHGFAICLPADTDPAKLTAGPDVVRIDLDPGVSVPPRRDTPLEQD